MGWKESDLRGRLQEALRREEILWRQKSPITWLTALYLDTKFFHVSTVVHRRRNCIDSIKTPSGSWLQNRNEIGDLSVQHFSHLFSKEPTWFPKGLDGLISKIITDQDNIMLCVVPEPEEIWEFVKSLGPTNPWTQWFLGHFFFQKYWQIIRGDLIAFVTRFFCSGFLLKEVNHTNVVIIPKSDNPTLITHYRPISLCNVGYKIISKLLAHRLGSVIHKLVFSTQSAFVLGRRIQDNIILMNKIMHTLKRKKGRGGLIALKIDMEKAYDKVD